jgi:nucleoside-diphosphate-sugar epimerase
VNDTATVELARAAVAAGVDRFVFTSTNLVDGPGRGRPARESDDPAPNGTYTESKAAAEEALPALARSDGLGLSVVRLAFVYGRESSTPPLPARHSDSGRSFPPSTWRRPPERSDPSVPQRTMRKQLFPSRFP